MPKFKVHIPVSIDLVVEVEAKNAEDALKKGFEADWSLNPQGAEIDATEAHEDLLKGNTCHAVLSQAYVEELKGE